MKRDEAPLRDCQERPMGVVVRNRLAQQAGAELEMLYGIFVRRRHGAARV
jgi:hypothetical protein